MKKAMIVGSVGDWVFWEGTWPAHGDHSERPVYTFGSIDKQSNEWYSSLEYAMAAAIAEKHEMWTWIQNQPDPADLFPYRMKDGPGNHWHKHDTHVPLLSLAAATEPSRHSAATGSFLSARAAPETTTCSACSSPTGPRSPSTGPCSIWACTTSSPSMSGKADR